MRPGKQVALQLLNAFKDKKVFLKKVDLTFFNSYELEHRGKKFKVMEYYYLFFPKTPVIWYKTWRGWRFLDDSEISKELFEGVEKTFSEFVECESKKGLTKEAKKSIEIVDKRILKKFRSWF